jgi:hypothetical protein
MLFSILQDWVLTTCGVFVVYGVLSEEVCVRLYTGLTYPSGGGTR